MTTITRTRFAPSPTGIMHVGGIRTALFAWLVAQKNEGKFILRIEDTDQAREMEGSGQHIIDCLRWLELIPDEGPAEFGGEYGPYLQSSRLNIYKKWAQKLIDSGRAYADPYSSEEVQDFRQQAQKEKRAFLYRHHRPETLPQGDGSQPLRFKSKPKNYSWHDEVMGDLQSSEEVVDDFIIMKSDGFPTYNFAHIVDDAEMQITHVIRGQEFLASMPNFLNLYEALDITPPVFATVPPIMNEQGNKKLSKRDGAKDILAYQKEGYLPEAMRNFLASLGWNDGTEQEIFATTELIEKFSLARVQKSGARFDEKRLVWLNGAHIRRLPADELLKQAEPFWPDEAIHAPDTYKKQVLLLAQDRMKTLADIRELGYFFKNPTIDMALLDRNKQLVAMSSEQREQLLEASQIALSRVQEWTDQAIQAALNELLEKTHQKPTILFSLIRLYTTWAPFSPELHKTLALIGKQSTLERLALRE